VRHSQSARVHTVFFLRSGWLRVARGGSRAKTPPLAARPLINLVRITRLVQWLCWVFEPSERKKERKKDSSSYSVQSQGTLGSRSTVTRMKWGFLILVPFLINKGNWIHHGTVDRDKNEFSLFALFRSRACARARTHARPDSPARSRHCKSRV